VRLPGGAPAWWRQDPERNVGLLTGESFEVLDVPGILGRAALERCARLGLRGPVARTGAGRYHFYVTAIGMANGFVPSQPGRARQRVLARHGRLGDRPAEPSHGRRGRPLAAAAVEPLPAAHLVLRELLDLQSDAAGSAPAAARR
jgi:Bifunctional DNA primase/polymerase, N-terminal